MQNLREELAGDLFRAGAIRGFSLQMRDGQCVIVYEMVDGSKGVIHTKRGGEKEYRVETALRVLRSMGLESVSVNMAGWSLGQGGLF